MSALPTIDEQSKLQAKTAAHYDAYPFDFLTPADEAAIREMQPEPFCRFVGNHIREGDRVCEIGCGPGRGTLFLTRQGIDVVAIDISQRSLALARSRAPDARFVCSSNVALPFRDDMFDVVVSDGVIHHTPNPRLAFAENARILRRSGFYYLGVYNKRGYYYYIYTFAGSPVRWLERHVIGRWLILATIVPLYWAIHLIKSGGKRTWRGAINFFYDYAITPCASFHTYEEICSWSMQEGLELVEYDPSLGNVHVFVFKKCRSARA